MRKLFILAAIAVCFVAVPSRHMMAQDTTGQAPAASEPLATPIPMQEDEKPASMIEKKDAGEKTEKAADEQATDQPKPKKKAVKKSTGAKKVHKARKSDRKSTESATQQGEPQTMSTSSQEPAATPGVMGSQSGKMKLRKFQGAKEITNEPGK